MRAFLVFGLFLAVATGMLPNMNEQCYHVVLL